MNVFISVYLATKAIFLSLNLYNIFSNKTLNKLFHCQNIYLATKKKSSLNVYFRRKIDYEQLIFFESLHINIIGNKKIHFSSLKLCI